MTSNGTGNRPTWQEACRMAWSRDATRRTLLYVSLSILATVGLLAVIGISEHVLQTGIVTGVAATAIVLYGVAEEAYDLRKYHEYMLADANFKAAIVRSWDRPNLALRGVMLAVAMVLTVIFMTGIFRITSWAATLWCFAIGGFVLMGIRIVHKWELHRELKGESSEKTS